MTQHDTRTRPMESGPIRDHVTRAYKNSLSYQWVRETLVNAIQAGAKNISYTTEWHAVRKNGVYRRMIIDDGPGISRTQMLELLNVFGGSGKSTGATSDNFGIGLKGSLLPWNTYGVVMISKTADGEVSMLWLHIDANGDPGARLFNLNDDEDRDLWDTVVPLDEYHRFIDEDTDPNLDWTKVFPAKQETGFAIILLGNSPDQDTVLGDPKRGESKKYGINQYINTRFLDVPINVHIDQYNHHSDRAKWPKGPVGSKTKNAPRQNRGTNGLRNIITEQLCAPSPDYPERGLVDSGSFVIPKTADFPAVRVHYYLSTQETSQQGHILTMPILGVIHASHPGINEVYDVSGMGNSLTLTNAKTRMNQFVTVAPVRDRLAILFEPLPTKGFEFIPDQSRTKVRFENETSGVQDMPWEEWARTWRAHEPKAVSDAVRAYYSSINESRPEGFSDKDLIRLGSKYGTRLKKMYATTRMLSDNHDDGLPNPPRKGTAAEQTGTQKSQRVRKRKPNPASGEAGNPTGDLADQHRKKYARVGLVECKIVREPGEDVIRYDSSNAVALLNVEHDRYKMIAEFVTEGYYDEHRTIDPGEAEPRKIIAAGALAATQLHVMLAVSDAVKEAAKRPSKAHEILAPEALAACLYGMRHIETLAFRHIGQQLAGNTKAKSAAA